jgi:hypothetical protein
MIPVPEYLYDRVRAPRDELRHLIELGYASRRKVDWEVAGVIDTWLCKQPFALDVLRKQETHRGS